MKRKGMSKKELKAPDEFQALMIEMWQKYGKYWKHFVVGVLILIAIPVFISLYTYYNAKKERDAFNAYQQVLAKFVSEKKATPLENFIKRYKGTKANILAQIRLANFYYNKGKYKKAMLIYKNLEKDNIDKEFKNFAKLCLAECYMQLKNENKAKEILTQLQNDKIIAPEVTLYLAFINEDKNNIAKAKQLYQKIIDDYKGFFYMRFAEAKVNEL